MWITTESTSAAATTFLERVTATLPYPIDDPEASKPLPDANAGTSW